MCDRDLAKLSREEYRIHIETLRAMTPEQRFALTMKLTEYHRKVRKSIEAYRKSKSPD